MHHEFMFAIHNTFVVVLAAEVKICLLYIVQARLSVGDIVECTIKRFVYFGIFVEVGLVPCTAV